MALSIWQHEQIADRLRSVVIPAKREWRVSTIRFQTIICLLAFSAIPFFAWSNDNLLWRAYQARQGNIQVQGAGTVIRLLPDDNQGSRHQRFILKLSHSQTLLIANNIDLVPRIPNLRLGDVVEFYGEYEWNSKGGVIHWTHRDPANRHAHGWLRHGGRVYE